MITVYYIGGPWDLHKVAEKSNPMGAVTIRVAGPYTRVGDINVVDHEYRVRPVGKDVFVAVHSDIRL